MHVRGVDGVSQASTHRHTNSLADERAELRARPAGRLEQRRGQLARLALVEPAHEGCSSACVTATVCCNGLPARTQDPAHQPSHAYSTGGCGTAARRDTHSCRLRLST